ncbi:MAG: rRNA methylase, partial [Chthonomonadales bacterium]|nr:rRNA methylase [Chthonomonadales bacterium]
EAAGVEGVIVVGNGSDPFHKNCVRAARGAVGRIPILSCRSLEQFLWHLQTTGCAVVGAALGADKTLFQCAMQPPIAVVVGNEQHGISRPVLEVCSAQVQIPMSPGQDSLNVGVATGLMLYEVFRQKTGHSAVFAQTNRAGA